MKLDNEEQNGIGSNWLQISESRKQPNRTNQIHFCRVVPTRLGPRDSGPPV